MQNDKIGNIIKEIRKQNNLTQKDFADKYHVTYQAVSKWENGKSIPDMSILKEISHDFNISLDNIVDGNLEIHKKNKNKIWIFIGIVIVILIILFAIIFKINGDFDSKTISSKCKDFNISGIISYNENKSLIYIPKIEYCGEDNDALFKEINCTLYEKNHDIIKKISSYYYDDSPINLRDFMKKVTFNVDNYLKVCKNYSDDSLYLEIKAIDVNGKSFFHNVGLTLDKQCQ